MNNMNSNNSSDNSGDMETKLTKLKSMLDKSLIFEGVFFVEKVLQSHFSFLM